MAISRGILSTDPQYKKWTQSFKAVNKKTEEKKTVQPVKKETRALTKTEQQAVNKMLEKYNAEIRNYYGLKQLPAGCEIR